MKLVETIIKDCYIIEWDHIIDERGSFNIPFNRLLFKVKTGIDFNSVQENESFSYKNTIRGLHLQLPPFDQAKLVRCTRGLITDVVVDVRRNSESYGRKIQVILSGGFNRSLFIPRGCAHGFSTQEDSTLNYKVDNTYSKISESGIIYNDPQLDIDWDVSKEFLISNKDKGLPFFKDLDIYK